MKQYSELVMFQSSYERTVFYERQIERKVMFRKNIIFFLEQRTCIDSPLNQFIPIRTLQQPL